MDKCYCPRNNCHFIILKKNKNLLMICAQAFYINAIALADASYIAPFSYMTLIFVTFYDFAIFHEIPDHISLIGISIILTGAILLAWREKIKLEPKI